MSTYNINFSDPLRSGFVIAPGGFNGPGGASVASALRLYGRGALEWGEAVDENMLRTLEMFNGATPPPFALGGQMWFQTKFYWLHAGFTWYLLDPDSPGTWTDIGPTGTNVVSGGIVGTNVPPPTVIGAYWYTGGAPVGNDAFGEPLKPTTLYFFEQYGGGQSVAAGWLERTNSEAAAAPVNGVDFPDRSLLVWDEFAEEWVSPPISIVSDTAPTNPLQGSLWWDTVGDDLYVWNEDTAAWEQIVTVPYADSPAGYIAKAGGTMSGALLLLPGTAAVPGLSFAGDPDTGMSAATPNTLVFSTAGVARQTISTTFVTFDLPLDMNGNNITDLPVQAYPLASSENAASIRYVNGLATAIGTPGPGGFSSITANGVGGAVSHKPGDIYINTSTGRIWIAVTTASSAPTFFASDGSDANWKQVFPALYS